MKLFTTLIKEQVNVDLELSDKLKDELYGRVDDDSFIVFLNREELEDLINDLKDDGRFEEAETMEKLWKKHSKGEELVFWMR